MGLGCEAFCVCDTQLLTMTISPFPGPRCEAFCASEVRVIMIIENPYSGPGHDAFFLTMAVWSVSGQGVAAVCTADEVKMLFTCITPHDPQFLNAFGQSSSVCDRSLISSYLCQ